MTETPDNKVQTEAPAQGASLSNAGQTTPEIQVTRGGKARPSVAGARVARPTVSPASIPAVEPQGNQQQDQVAEQAPSTSAAQPSEGAKRPSVAGKRDSASDVRSRATAKKPKKRRNLRPVFVVITVVLCVVAIVAGAIAAVRWVLPNDVADIQGTWVTVEDGAPITVTDSTIVLSDDVTYDYTLDTLEKTIDARFFTLEGESHYRFSRDRQSVAIIEGKNFTWQGTLQEDLAWMWEDFMALIREEPLDPLGNNQGITLHRVAQ